MECRPYLLHALSPLHVGTGQSVGVIDLPLARQKATGIPIVPGSSLKGVLRELRRPREESGSASGLHDAVFGPRRKKPGVEGDEPGDYAGALVVGDARLLALPVRSFVGTFALVTSPLLLALARRDLGALAEAWPVVAPLEGRRAQVASLKGSLVVYSAEGSAAAVYLEDLDLPVAQEPDTALATWAQGLAGLLPDAERELLTRRLVLVDDETMSFLWETATQVDTRVSIEPDTGTAADGHLWTEESLPAETLLVGVLGATGTFNAAPRKLTPDEVLGEALGGEGAVLQLGGKATVGRGRCRLSAWRPSVVGGAR
ncbi:type III-B CRISPR module RAMP protein Cmr4 [Corallococcus macrosporus]|uniref:Type III-B CRISPR module RAMP protein Cmr4 n=1 Tax=Corallococcus macrosporus DSM 14697 TaxID=1189310 RepID=A0A286NVZ3_9BACT|nr:type III-B CRISPR module RAMP protein Cmr4 [Corallococcus macrosporus]ATB51338.1 type III-B CRISPR module RAMP protein Cmr4 [Corallococcus macrosporus DSM 14697]